DIGVRLLRRARLRRRLRAGARAARPDRGPAGGGPLEHRRGHRPRPERRHAPDRHRSLVDADRDTVASPARPVAGDGLLHPAPLAAIGLLLLNDHWLKAAFPGSITGKLSDFAGLAFFPLF